MRQKTICGKVENLRGEWNVMIYDNEYFGLDEKVRDNSEENSKELGFSGLEEKALKHGDILSKAVDTLGTLHDKYSQIKDLLRTYDFAEKYAREAEQIEEKKEESIKLFNFMKRRNEYLEKEELIKYTCELSENELYISGFLRLLKEERSKKKKYFNS